MDYEKIEKTEKETLADVIENLRNGIVSWHNKAARILPSNPVSEIFYTGINRFLLYSYAKANGYDDSYWCTKKQAQDKGWSIKEGQSPITLVRIKEFEEKKVKKVVNGKEKTVIEKVELPEKEISTFQVYNIAQLDNVELKDHKLSDSELEKIGQRLDVKDISSEDFTDKKEYASACIHQAVFETVKDKENSLCMDLAETFVCNSLGVDVKEGKAPSTDEWANEIENDNSVFFKAVAAAEKASQKILNKYQKNIEKHKNKNGKKYKETGKKAASDNQSYDSEVLDNKVLDNKVDDSKIPESEECCDENFNFENINAFDTYQDVARNLQKLCMMNNDFFDNEDILNALKEKKTRKLVISSLLKYYSERKNRNHIRDLVLIGKIISSMSVEKFNGKDKDISIIKRETKIIEDQADSIDFGENYEKHPYILATSISSAASNILKLSKDEIFEKLKDKDGRTEVIDLLGNIYMNKIEQSVSDPQVVTDIKLIKSIMSEIVLLDNPDLIKEKNKEVRKTNIVDLDEKKVYKDFTSSLEDGFSSNKSLNNYPRNRRGKRR